MITTQSVKKIGIVTSTASLEAAYAIRLTDGSERRVQPNDECLYVLHQFVPREAWGDIVLSERELAPLRARFSHVTQERANKVIQQIFAKMDDGDWQSLRDQAGWCSVQ